MDKMDNRIYPLTFQPEFRHYIWGGRNLERLGRTLPDGIIAESWEISGYHASPTVVDAGPLQGWALTDLVSELGLDLLGQKNRAALARDRFPLLVKLLDANRKLSVQVHPPDTYAYEHENGELGKTEMWYILYAEPGARIIYGVRPGVTRNIFRQELEAGKLEHCMLYLPVHPGDAILLKAGSLHALLEGVMAVEIQQNSDVTYRVYDWNRVDPDGKSRPLHIEKALDVIDFDLVEPGPFPPVLIQDHAGIRRELISTSNVFDVEKVQLDAGVSYVGDCNDETFEIWGCLEGECEIHWAGDPLTLPAVRFTLLPAALGRFQVHAETPATLLRSWAGG